MQGNASTVLLDTMFHEALTLTREVQHYIASTAPGDRASLDTTARMTMASEITRLTRRLTVAVVWLRLQRSVQNGEMSHDDICARFPPLCDNLVCLDDASGNQALPARLRSLLRRSLQVYQRISRLDRRMRDRAGAGESVAQPIPDMPGVHTLHTDIRGRAPCSPV
ncbi:MAG: DUF1465 family protein [Alphaproteobacteria bacterium]